MSEMGQKGECHLTLERIRDKIDKLTVVMSRLAAKDSHEKRPLNPKYIRVEVRVDLIIRKLSEQAR